MTAQPVLGLDPKDNARCESYFATLECELLDRTRFSSDAETPMAVFEFIEGWYRPCRRHSASGSLSPMESERIQLPPPLAKPVTAHESGPNPNL